MVEQSSQLTLFAGGSHVKTCPLPDIVRDWLENAADCGMNFNEYSMKRDQSGVLA